jgi:hypothetical protein
MRNLGIIIIITCHLGLYGQSAKELKQKVQNQIQISIKDQFYADYWLICNKDNAYYNSDTIKLYNYITNIYNSNYCCSFVVWYFRSKSNFSFSETVVCDQPYNTKVVYKNICHCKIKWKILNDQLILIKKCDLKKDEKYLVLDLKKELLPWGTFSNYILTMKRIK